MSTITTGSAELMPGHPSTEDGHGMPLASWYRLSVRTGVYRYVIVTGSGVYESNPLGQIHDFFQCLHVRASGESQAEALRHIGFELAR